MGFLDKCNNCISLPSITDDPLETRKLPYGKWYPGPQNTIKQCFKTTDDNDNDNNVPILVRQVFVREDFN